ncbi:hypothetical protein FB567DRAFT_550837 [Paraphoma chrysanthemicola]|uniref:Uncharacterized protein n=1 Tax=Paraphoma chrysanthemicola TaxID=798071 RepID=A0A8K0VWR1_9PLEO|nr:hypothetical protein FB567DRAFT_550837 [Paraphoma chrysanthemicola]
MSFGNMSFNDRYEPKLRDHVSKILFKLPNNATPLETQHFLDNIDYLLAGSDFRHTKFWGRVPRSPEVAIFDGHNPQCFHKFELEILNLAEEEAATHTAGYRARILVARDVTFEGQPIGTEADALIDLYNEVERAAETHREARRLRYDQAPKKEPRTYAEKVQAFLRDKREGYLRAKEQTAAQEREMIRNTEGPGRESVKMHAS